MSENCFHEKLPNALVRLAGGYQKAWWLPCAGLAFSISSLFLFLQHGLTPETMELFCLTFLLALAALADLRWHVIPNKLIACGVAIRLVFFAFLAICLCADTTFRAGYGNFQGIMELSRVSGTLDLDGLSLMFGNALANAFSVLGVTLAAGFITTKLFHRKSIGGGDIKLLALIAFYLDFGQTVFVVILSCCIGILYALVETAKEGKRLDAFPFAPCICLAAYVVLIC